MDIKNTQDILKIVKMLRKAGVRSFEWQGLKLELGPQPEPKTRRRRSDTKDDIKVDRRFTDEDVLLWSSNSLDEVRF